MTSKMSEKEKLRAWLEKEKAKGLVDFKVTPAWMFRENFPQGVTVEDICRDINAMNDAIEQGRSRIMTAADFGEEETVKPLRGI